VTAVEVASALHPAARCVEEGVVVGGVDLDLYPAPYPLQCVAESAAHVWRATNRILILHLPIQLQELLAAEAVAGEDLLGIQRQLGICQQIPDDTCALDLTGVRLLLVDKGVEMSPVAKQRLRRHRRAQV
jgi:hypothetical protein